MGYNSLYSSRCPCPHTAPSPRTSSTPRTRKHIYMYINIIIWDINRYTAHIVLVPTLLLHLALLGRLEQ